MQESADMGLGIMGRRIHLAMPLDEADEILIHLAGVVARGDGPGALRAAGARIMLAAKDAGHDGAGIAAMRSALSVPSAASDRSANPDGADVDVGAGPVAVAGGHLAALARAWEHSSISADDVSATKGTRANSRGLTH